jgi:CO/xanthine dehydrogenase Mo-binding subunit
MPVGTEWAYGKIANVLEEAYGMPNLGADSLSGGLRGNIMRTPFQRQQNFAVECMINEAASAAGADPLKFRLKHTADQRLIDVLKATAEAAGWQTRPSPHSNARKSGAAAVAGRGIGVIIRESAYWAGIAEIEVTPATGAVQVTRFTMGLDCGKIINPRQLNRVMRGGLVMGISEALKEEVTFDAGKVTSTDWLRCPILTVQGMPEIKLVHVPREDKGFGTGGEAANAVAPAAIAAAFFDATGVPARRLPLTPKHVQAMLKS